MGEPQICFSCGVADSTEIWHAGLSVSLRAESMPVFNTKKLLLLCLLGVSTCAADWLKFGVGEWSLDPVPQSWFGWLGLPICHSFSQAVILAGTIHLLVLHYLYSLSNWSHSQKVIRKAFLTEEPWRFFNPLCFLPCFFSPNIFTLGTDVNGTLKNLESFL